MLYRVPGAFVFLLHLRDEQSAGVNFYIRVVLAADRLFYSRDDRLCTTLKEGLVLDFREWEDAKTYENALASRVSVLSRERS